MGEGSGSVVRNSSIGTKAATTAIACVAALALLAWPAGASAYTATDVNTAVANGVAFLDTQQNADGSFGSSYPAAETGFAIVAYGVLSGGDYTTLSATYQDHLRQAVSWLLTQQDAISGAFAPGTFTETYSTGIALDALSLSAGIVPGIPAAIAAGRSWLISHQNAPPSVTGNPASPDCTGADGSGSEQYCGSWSYEGDFFTGDESNTGFALTGLALTGGVPAATAAVNLEWQRHVQELKATNPLAFQNTGGGSYVPGCGGGGFCSNANNTGSLTFGYGYDGLPASDPKVAAALLFGQDVLDEYELMKSTVRTMIYHPGPERDGTCDMSVPGCTWAIAGDGGYHYSIWALTKGLGQYIPANIADPTNWYAQVVDLLLTQQGADGSWPYDSRDDGSIIGATSFAIGALGLVGVPTSDLSITKTDSPDPVTAGNTLTYSLTVRNGGSADATGVSVTDTLPGGVTFVSATSSSGSCSEASGTVTCTIGDLANGASATVEIKVTPQNPGPITNTASVSGDQPDPDTGNNTASQGTTVVSTPTGGTLEVRKVLSPTSDTGVFNLQIDGTTVTANASNGGTTGKRPVSVGDHTVGETAGTGTILSDYTSATTCKDQGGAGSTIASSTGAGVLHVNVTANADVVCTITNTRGGSTGNGRTKPGKGCGDKNHVHERFNECASKPGKPVGGNR
jgi:uncharacterized repeat protein (TIGR01451 family)